MTSLAKNSFPFTKAFRVICLLAIFFSSAEMVAAQADPLPPRAKYRIGDLKFRTGGRVYGLDFSPDGKIIFSSGPILPMVAWDVATGKDVASFPVKAANPRRLALSADRKTLTIIDRFEHLQQFAFPDGKETRRQGFSGTCYGVSADGDLAAIAADKGPIQVLDVRANKILQNIAHNASIYTSVAFLPSGKTLACCEPKGPVQFFDIATGKMVREIADVKSANRITFSPDGRLLLVEQQDRHSNSCRLYEVADGRLRYELATELSYFIRGVFSPDGNSLAIIEKNAVNLYDTPSGRLVHRLTGPVDRLYALAFAPDGKTLASAGADGLIRFWDPRTGRELQPLAGLPHSMVAVRSVPGTLAYASADGRLMLCDPDTRTIRQTLTMPGPVHVPALAFTADGRMLAYRSSKDTVTFLDPGTGNPLGQFSGLPEGAGLAFDSDGKTLITTVAHQPSVVRAAPSGKLLRTMDLSEDHPLSAGQVLKEPRLSNEHSVVSLDGRWLITELRAGGFQPNPRVRLWNIAVSSKVSWFSANASYNSFAFAPDGRTVACVKRWGLDNYVLGLGVDLLEVATGCRRIAIRADYPNPSDRVQYDNFSHRAVVAFAPNGTLLAVLRDKTTIEILDPKCGKSLEILRGHRGRIRDLAFSPDSKILYSTSTDTTLVAWDLAGLNLKAGFRPRSLSNAEILAFWNEMDKRNVSDGQVKETVSAWQELAASPEETVAFMADRLVPVPPPDREQVVQWLKELGDPRYQVRDQALQALDNRKELVEADFKRLLTSRPSLEVQRRVEVLMRKLAQYREEPLAGDRLRQWRALEVLETIGTPAARAVVERLASGARGAWLTVEASQTLSRWH